MGRMKKKIEARFGKKIQGKVRENIKERIRELLEDPPGEEGTEPPKPDEPEKHGLLGKIQNAFASDDELDDLEKKHGYKFGDFTKGAINKVKKKIKDRKNKD